jgi:hypothetical protein
VAEWRPEGWGKAWFVGVSATQTGEIENAVVELRDVDAGVFASLK